MKLSLDRIVFTVSLLLATGVVFSGCASSSADPEFSSAPAVAQAIEPVSPQPTQETGGLRFQVGDTVIVTFSDTVTEMKPHEERVKEDGNITLPLDKTTKKVRMSAIQHRLIALTKEIPDDKEILDIIKEYNTELGSNTGSNQKLLIPATDQDKQQKPK